jgi:hypothetical protein
VKLPGVTRVVEGPSRSGAVSRILYIDSDHLGKCAQLWRSGTYTHLGLESYRDAFKLPDLDFLSGFPEVHLITMTLDHRVDLGSLQRHAKRLVEFSCNDEINFIAEPAQFKKLTRLRMRWSPKVNFEGTLPRLIELGLGHFRPRSRDLKLLPAAPRLARLALGPAAVDALTGLERYERLKELVLYRVPQLENVESLRAMGRLKSLDLDGCNGPFELGRALREKMPLVELKYCKSTPLPSVDFVTRLQRLRDFIFLNTDVTDGDMSALLSHPTLSYVAFTNKRHFSHSMSEVNASRVRRPARASNREH